jgi:GTP-binding protein Era
VFPISARTGSGVEQLLAHLCALLPHGPFLFGDAGTSDQPLQLLLAELVREAVIVRTYRELPHAVEVLVEEVERARDGLVRVRALIWVESVSQKRIVVGARGRMIAAIGSAARKQLERELGARVHLDVTVRVRRRWRADEALLDRLGIT